MKRDPLVHELTDWIENLESDVKLDWENSQSLQHLLIRCRRELIRNPNDEQVEKQSELQKQVKAEIEKQKAKLGIKE